MNICDISIDNILTVRNDFQITIGNASGQPGINPVCFDRMISVGNKQRYNITCSTVMRGQYVTFIRDPDSDKSKNHATLCEVVAMGTRIIGNQIDKTQSFARQPHFE